MGSAEGGELKLESVEEGHGKRPSKPQPPAEGADDGVDAWWCDCELLVGMAAVGDVELDSEEEEGQGKSPNKPHPPSCDEGESEDGVDEELGLDEEPDDPEGEGFSIPPPPPPIDVRHKFNPSATR